MPEVDRRSIPTVATPPRTVQSTFSVGCHRSLPPLRKLKGGKHQPLPENTDVMKLPRMQTLRVGGFPPSVSWEFVGNMQETSVR